MQNRTQAIIAACGFGTSPASVPSRYTRYFIASATASHARYTTLVVADTIKPPGASGSSVSGTSNGAAVTAPTGADSLPAWSRFSPVYTWEGQRYGLTLAVRHGDLTFALVLPPQMWELAPDILRTQTVVIVTDLQHRNEDEGSITGMILGQENQLLHTALKVYNVHKGLSAMPE